MDCISNEILNLQEMYEQYIAGVSIVKLKNKYNLDHRTIIKKFKDHQFIVFSNKEKKQNIENYLQNNSQNIINSYNENKSIKEIQKIFNLNYKSLSNFFKQNCIKNQLYINNEYFCCKCNAQKTKNDYYIINNKIQKPCKDCKYEFRKTNKIKRSKWSLKYRNLNKIRLNDIKKEYYKLSENKEKIREANKLWRENNKEEKRRIDKEYYQNNKQKIKDNLKNKERRRIYEKKKFNLDVCFKLRKYISASINKELSKNLSSKNNISIIKNFGYTIEDLKIHIENLFEPWMNWNNRKNYKFEKWNDNDQSTWVWHLDHIIPQSKLPYKSMQDENFKKVWSLENLRPYSAKQNIIDGNNRTEEEIFKIKNEIKEKLLKKEK